MGSPRIAYTSRADATAGAEIASLAEVYRFVLDSHARKEAATSPVCRPDDARKDQDAGTYHHST